MTRREVAMEYGVEEKAVPFDDANVEVRPLKKSFL